MSLKWRTVELKSIAEVIMGQSPKSEFYNQNGKGMPFLQGNKTFGDKYPSFELFTTSIKKVAEKDSVLMSVRAPVGDLNIAQEDICIGRGVCSIKMKNGYNEFLYYLLKANISQLINKESGTVFGSINKNDIETFEVTLPTEPKDQVKLLNILKNIDRKIENCNSINKNLSSLSSNIFRYLINEDNIDTYLELKDVCKFIKGKKPKEISDNYQSNFLYYLTIEALSNQNQSYAYDEKGVEANEYDILMVMDGASSGKMFYGKNGLVGSTLAKIDVKLQYQEIIFQFLKYYEKYISDNTTGSAIPHTDKGLVLNLKCPISDKILEYSSFFKDIRTSIIKNNDEIITLQKIRDTLLPKLMSGEIDVSKINCDMIKISIKNLDNKFTVSFQNNLIKVIS